MKTAKKRKTISPAQRMLFWRAFASACVNLGISGSDREEYRHTIMRETCNCEHLADIGRTKDFDRVIFRLRTDAGDFDEALKYSVSEERRVGHLIKVLCLQIMQLKGVSPSDARSYLGGILDQAKCPNGTNTDDDSYWMDLSLSESLNIMRILDTHRRRMLRSFGSSNLIFSPIVKYQVNGPVLIREAVHPSFYATEPFAVNMRKSLNLTK